MLSTLLLSFVSVALGVNAASRTSPPSGAYVVNQSDTASGQYATISDAIDALPDNGSDVVIFIYPGTYNEQVYIDTSDSVTIYGYTEDTTSYDVNQVNVVVSLGASETGSDDTTATIRVHSDNVAIYNLNLYNEWENSGNAQSQALALSAYGSNFGAYVSCFYSYQDTLLAESGNQVYLNNYINGAVDYIWGQSARAWFQGNTLASNGPGTITAAGPSSSSVGQLYVFYDNKVTASSGYTTTGEVYFGRPWSEYAHVVFIDTTVSDIVAPALWEEWSSSEPNTADVLFADYGTTGISDISRPSFATLLTSSEAATYTISYVLGSDYADWVDTSYL